MGPLQSAAPSHERPTSTPTPEQIRCQLQKILDSRVFIRSERMRRFLRFAVEQVLTGGGHIKEYLIGLEVFDRRAEYDPRLDPIVRVEARRLRAKLKAYYKSAGRHDDVIIDFPKGVYTPSFAPRAAASVLAPSAAADQETSVAVLPFDNLSAEAADDYFSDGLTEELILLLTRVRGLRVVAWNSSSKFRGREQDLTSVRQELKVQVALRGSVRRTANRVRVTAQLIDTASGAYLWSEGFNRSTHDVLAIQEEIARAIVETLRLALEPRRLHPAVPKKLNLDCYNLCLQARFHAHGRTSSGLEKSLECYLRAVREDPESAVAHAGLADAYSLLADYGVMHPSQAMPRAEAEARQALELDPDSAEANSSLAYILSLFHWKWAEAEELYRRAIALNPSYSKARHWLGIDLLTLLHRFDEAESEVHIARELDPLSVIIQEASPYVQFLRRNYDRALEELRHLAALDPTFHKARSGIGRVLSLMGRYDEAIPHFEKARELAGRVPNVLSALGQTLALAGRREEALRCLQELHSVARNTYVPSTCFSVVHLGLGEPDRSLDWLEGAMEQHELPLPIVNVHPVYDPLRSEPRFRKILARMGFLP